MAQNNSGLKKRLLVEIADKQNIAIEKLNQRKGFEFNSCFQLLITFIATFNSFVLK